MIHMKYELFSYFWCTCSLRWFHTSWVWKYEMISYFCASKVLIVFILLQNGRNRFHKTGARRFSKRFSVLLNFLVPPRLKIPAMSPWSTNWFHTSNEYEVWIDFILLREQSMKCAREVLILFKPQPVRSMNRFHTSVRAKYEMCTRSSNCFQTSTG